MERLLCPIHPWDPDPITFEDYSFHHRWGMARGDLPLGLQIPK